MEPTFPVLSFQSSPKAPVCIVETSADLQYCNLAGWYGLEDDPEIFFDVTGGVYHRQVELQKTFGKLQRVLSYVYWGRIPCKSEWQRVRDYTLDELKARIIACVKADDDILTQFIEEERLINLINQARHFEDVYMVLANAIYNFEEDESLLE